MRPDLLLLDEPTRGMDGLRKLALGELATALASEGTAVALITHDIDFAAEAAQAVTTMAHGRVLADRAPRVGAGRRPVLRRPGRAGNRPRLGGRGRRRAAHRDGGDACLAWC